MIDKFYVVAIGSIWVSIVFMGVTLIGAVVYLFRHLHATDSMAMPALKRYPVVSVVVPAHNEVLVIQATMRAILRMNYPAAKMQLLLYADNCSDDTAALARAVQGEPEFAAHDVHVIERKGKGGKAGVLNDALKIAKGEYIAVYDADAAPEQNALYFLIAKVLQDPKRYAAAIGRNKTRNFRQNFLTRCINLEILATQNVQHTGYWQLFGIGHIPGTNFVIHTSTVRAMGGWNDGALTEDTAISFRLMAQGKQIALAHRAEAFQQEPETLKSYYYQRKRWAKGNFEVILDNFTHLFDRTNWRVKLEVIYYLGTYFWFNCAIVISNLIFIANTGLVIAQLVDPTLHPLVDLPTNLAFVLLLNWLLMFQLYLVQVNIGLAADFGQANVKNFLYSLVSYFTYSQLFLFVSLVAGWDLLVDKVTRKQRNNWVKTQRF